MSSSDITKDRSSSRTRPTKISAIRNGVGGGVHRADSKVYFWYRNEENNVMDLDNQNVLLGSKHRNYFSKLTTCLNDSFSEGVPNFLKRVLERSAYRGTNWSDFHARTTASLGFYATIHYQRGRCE